MRKLYAATISKAFAAFVFVLTVFYSQNLRAQTAANYAYSTATNGSLVLDKDGNAIDMSSGTTQLYGAGVDTYTATLQSLGFEFFFMGARYGQFSANPDGQVRLGSTVISGHTTTAAANTAYIIANNIDGLSASNGKVVYKIQTGTAGKVLIIEWNNILLRYDGATSPASTYQLRLYENSGVIEMVYGNMANNSASAQTSSIGFSSSNTAGTIGQLTTIAGTPTYSTSATSYTTTSFTASSAMANLNSSSDGSRRVFRFTPPAPSAAPTALNFTAIGAGAMTLNWTDNSSNEVGFAVYRSTDNVNFSYVGMAAANAGSSVQTGLSSGTTYYWRVYAVTEGGVSATLSATQATNAGSLSGSKTVGGGGADYATLTAAFNDINTNGLSGNLTLVLQAGYLASNEPAFPIPTSGSVVGANTVTIYPAVSGLSITSANTTGTLNFNGGKNIVIDGRVGGTGSTPDLVIENTNAGTSYAVQFINDATGNTIKYANIKSRNTSTSSGTIVFAGGVSSGNDNNTIDNNNISDGTSTPLNAIYSSGTSAAIDNSGNTVSNNNIFNFFSAGSATHGIYLTSGNSGWSITGNSLFQTAARVYTTSNTHYGIRIDNTSGNGFTVSNNFIGGGAAAAGGTAYTMSGVSSLFRGVYVNVGSTSATSVQGNTVTNFSFSTGSTTTTLPGYFSGIHVGAGLVNVGTVSGNTIGATSGTGSINIIATSTGGLFTGIYATSSAVVTIQNNNIGSISTGGTATMGYTFHGISIAGSGNHVVSQNTIGSATANSIAIGTNGTTTATVTAIGIANTNSGSGIITISSNTINNLSAFSTGSSTVFRGIHTSSGTVTISNNTISNLSSNTTSTSVSSGGLAGLGIYFSGGTTPLITGNTIYNLSLTNNGTGGYNLAGISYTAPTTSMTITKNRIYGLSNASTATSATGPATVSGIFVRDGSGANTTFANNMISLGNGQTTNTAFIGIWAQYTSSTTTTLKVYHNTINVEGTAASGAQPSFALYRGDFSTSAVTVFTMDVKNNIFTNTRTGGTGKHYAIANNYGVTTSSATGWGANASNYNLLNGGVNTTVGYWSGDRDFAAWKTASAGDGNSFSGATVTYVNSANDLHLNMGANPTVIESGGTPVSVTDDFDGTVRSTTFPDLGADEGNYTLLDNAAPQINYTVLGVSCAPGSRTLTNVTIVDAGGVPTTGALVPRIYFKKGSGAWASTPGTLTSGDGFNGVWSFDIDATLVGGVTTGDVISYYIIAQDQNSTPNIGSKPAGVSATDVNTVVVHPSTPNTYNNAANLASVNTVGAGGTYATLTAAANAYNNGCMSGPVIFNLTDAAYGAGETFPIVFNSNVQASSTNTLTIKPATGVTATISGAVASGALIKFNGADYITIDGSNSGGTDRSLTINNTSTTTPTVVNVSSLGLADGALSITVKNCNITSGATGTSYGIASTGSAIPSAGADNDNLTIQNNNITGVSVGVYANGSTAVSAGALDNLSITGNTIAINTTSTATFGIQAGNALTSVISQNAINVLTSAGTPPVGISLEAGFLSSSVTRNNITRVQTTSTNGWGGRGITIGTGSATSSLTVANNSVAGVNGSNYTGFTNSSSMGIGIGVPGNSTTFGTTTGGINLYYNSVNLYGNYTYGASNITAALYVGTSTSALDIRNNVFVNTLANTDATYAATSKAYAVYSAISNTAFTQINYNDYFVSGAQGVLGYLSSDKADLAAWKTATGKDANSLNVNPNFNSNTILAPSSGGVGSIVGAGTPVSITTDILGATRSATTPTMGAYESAGDFAAPVISYTALGVYCSTGDRQVNGVVITDASGVATTAGSEPRIYFKKGINGTWYSKAGTLASGTATNGTWNFTIEAALMGGLATSDQVYYFIVAQDIAGTPNVGSSPADIVATSVTAITAYPPTPGNYSITNSLNGAYTVGSGGAYPTITAAVAAYQSSCLTGHVIFNLTDATYGGGETFPIVINAHTDASASATLTIKPASGANAVVVSGSGAAIFKLNGAKYVTIDGSNNSTTSRNLSLNNTATGDGTTSIWIQSTGVGAGASNVTVKNSNLSNGNSSNSNTFGVFAGGEDNDNVTIQNNAVSKANFGIYISGTAAVSAGGNDNLVISGNSVGSSDPASYIITNGIYVAGSIAPTVSDNTVFNVKTNASINNSGIEIAGNVVNGSVTRNTISGIYSTSSNGWGAYGIHFSSTTGTTGVTVSNNVIYDIVTANYSTTSATYNAFGIRLAGGTNLKIYHNSIHLYGSVTSGSSAGMSANLVITTASVTGLDLRNNVFSNTQTFGTSGSYAYNVYLDASVTFGNINYNDYYGTNGTNTTYRVGYGGSARVTLADWKTYTTQDVNSIGVNPLFNADVVLMPAAGSPLVGAGTPLAAVTTDIKGVTRSATTPTIGAYETAGDGAPPAITVSALSYACSTGDQSISANITDATGIPTTGTFVPRIYYKKNAGGAWFSQPGTLASGTATNSTWNFTIVAADMGGLLTTDVIYYYVAAQDVVSTPNVGSSPAGVTATDVNTVTIHPTTPLQMVLTGTVMNNNYNVGGGGAYTTLTAAVAAYNQACLTGAVTFTLTDAGYNTNETFPIVINANAYASSVNTLTIKPAANTAVLVQGTSGASADGLIKLNGADYVIVDGINDAAGTKLTLENTSTTSGSAVIWLASTGAGQGATNNTIKNVILKGGIDQKAGTGTSYGVVIAGNTLSGTITSVAAGNDNDNNTIDTCTFSKLRYGIYTRGGSAANPNTGTVIKRNVIGSSTFGVDEIGKAGIVVREEDGIQIMNNEIRYVGGDFNNNPGSSTRAGIALATDASWTPTSVFVKNAKVMNNTIHDIMDEKTGAAVGVILAGADGTNATNNIVANNFIYNVKANGTSGSNQAVGIGVSAGNGDKVVYNSISLSGSVIPSTGATTPTVSNFGIRVSSTSASNLSILNNIVYMDLTGGTMSNYAIDLPTGYAFGTGNMNYNNWFANPANAQSKTGSYNNGAANQSANLAAWQGATSLDGNSKEIDPQFISATDLHLQPSSSLDGQGIAVAGVTTDIDGELRSATTPDIGADELPAAVGIDMKPLALSSPVVQAKGCYNEEAIQVNIQNNGSSTINFAGTPVTVTVNVTGANTATYTKIINTGTLAAGAVLPVTLSTAGTDLDMTIPGVYVFDITTAISGDVNTANDVLQETRTKEALTAGSASTTPTDYCSVGGKPTLSTTGANGYTSLQWMETVTSGSGYSNIAGATTPNFTVAANITQTMYYKLVATCGAATDESGEMVVALNNPQPLTTTPATRCGVGPVTLSATANPGEVISWYATSTASTPLATGASYSPTISGNTTYYVGVLSGGTVPPTHVGKPTYGTDGTNTAGAYLVFDALTSFNLKSVVIYPYSATNGTAGTVTINWQNSTGTTIQSKTVNVTGNNTASPVRVDLDFAIVPGTDYRLVYGSSTGVTALYRDFSGPYAYPYTVPGVVSIKTSSLGDSYYYYFYDWIVGNGCEGTRVPVTATVTAPPALTAVTATPASICAGQSSNLQVSSANANYTYSWAPVGQNGPSVSVTPSSTTVYTVTATDAGTGCVITGTANVTVNPLPTPIVFTPATVALCPGSPAQQLAFTGGTLTNVPLLSEDFNGSATGWTTTNASTGASAAATSWLPQTGPYTWSGTAGITSNDNSQFYASNSDLGGSGSVTLVTLASPAFSTVGFTSVNLSYYNFYQYWNTGDTVQVQVSTNGGTNWTVVKQYPQATQGAAATFQSESLNLDAYAGMPSVMVRFRYRAAWGYGWAIDNLVVSGTAPTSITWSPSAGLYTDAAGTTAYTGTATSTVYANPVANATYTATATSSASCTATNTVNVTRSSAITNATVLAGTAGGAQVCSGNQDVAVSTNFFNNCNIIATVDPSGGAAVSGNVNACVKIDNTLPSAPNGQKYVQRYFEITPATNRTTATSSITLYFTQGEFNAYNANNNGYPALPTGAADATGIANLRVTQFNHGGVGTDFATYPAGTGSIIDPTDASITYDGAANGGAGMWKVTFNATGSGAFFVHTGNFVLPVTITNFKGENAGSVNKLYWSTSTEINNYGFELERSADGVNYSKLTFVATKANGGNSTSQLSYNFDDVRPLVGANYYRLKQIDNNGKFVYSGVVVLNRKVSEITLTKVYPNPATREINVVITSPRSEKLTLVVTDLTGKVVMQTSTNVVTGDNQQQLNVSALAGGTYMIKAICANGCETAVHRFVKQ